MALDAASRTPPSRAQYRLCKSDRGPPRLHPRGLGSSWDHRRIEPFATEVLMRCSIPVDGRAFGRPSLTDNRRYFALALWVDKDETFAAEAVQILFDNPTDQHRGGARIERVASL